MQGSYLGSKTMETNCTSSWKLLLVRKPLNKDRIKVSSLEPTNVFINLGVHPLALGITYLLKLVRRKAILPTHRAHPRHFYFIFHALFINVKLT